MNHLFLVCITLSVAWLLLNFMFPLLELVSCFVHSLSLLLFSRPNYQCTTHFCLGNIYNMYQYIS